VTAIKGKTSMTLTTTAEDFLAQKRIAIVGMSRQKGTGNIIYDRLKARGYEVFAVNPNVDQIDGIPVYPNLKAIPDGVDAVMIVTRPEVSESVVHECKEVGVTRVWMHNNPMFGAAASSASPEAVDFCKANGISVVDTGCPLMFDPTADFAHKCMKWFLGVTGKMER
jgi:uncharacterized protein